MNKTNAMRLLESAGIEFNVVEYEVDEDDLSGVHAAQISGVPMEKMFKTLVARGDKTGINVFCIPVAEELDLKKAAKESGNKKIEMVAVKELLGLTGYIRGGCSPVGMKKRYPTYIDETCVLFDSISISGGMRGVQILTEPEGLCAYLSAKQCALTV